MRRIALVSCSRKKAAEKCAAKDLYTSALFRKARQFAELYCDGWYILSAKHGLLMPGRVIAPYDQTLTTQSPGERATWARRVGKQIHKRFPDPVEFVIVAGRKYWEELAPSLAADGHEVRIPLSGLSIGKQLQALSGLTNERIRDLDFFYRLLADLAEAVDGPRLLGDAVGYQDWPKRGIYFFFEPEERRRHQRHQNRVVRVGTHAVSRESKSSLWGRLRTHRGTTAGAGSHRSSVFRLHVGFALLNRLRSQNGSFDGAPATWGQGQSADWNIRKKEEWLEREVSRFLGEMEVLWLAVDDPPGPRSDRAFFERNILGLLAGPVLPLDPPSAEWLGNFSEHPQIRRTGLWNVDYVSDSYDRRFLSILSEYVALAKAGRPAPGQSCAPADWFRRSDPSQQELF